LLHRRRWPHGVPALRIGARPLVHREEVKIMRKYETMYIIKPFYEDDKYQEIIEKYNALIRSNGGEILKEEPWGKRRLAYEIEKIREGYYVLLNFQGPEALPAELERNFRIADDIMRYLVIRLED
jgi:small subunit ribosomal protein S6